MSLLIGGPKVTATTPKPTIKATLRYSDSYGGGAAYGLGTGEHPIQYEWPASGDMTAGRWLILGSTGVPFEFAAAPFSTVAPGAVGTIIVSGTITYPGTGGRSYPFRFERLPVETAAGVVDLRVSINAPLQMSPTAGADIAARALQSAEAAEQRAQQAAASAQGSATLSAQAAQAPRLVAVGTARLTNRLTGSAAGTYTFAPNGTTVVAVDTVRELPLGVPKSYVVTLTAAGAAYLGHDLSAADTGGGVNPGQRHQFGVWVEQAILSANSATLGFHWHNVEASGNILQVQASGFFTPAELNTPGATKTVDGLSVTVSAVKRGLSHLQLSITPARTTLRGRVYLAFAGVVLNANPDVRKGYVQHPVFIGNALDPIDPATVYPDGSEATAGGVLPRRTGGSGIVVLDGEAFRTALAGDYTAYAVAAHIDALNRAIDLRRGGDADVTGQPPFTPPNSYYLPPGSGGALTNFVPMPASGLPASAIPSNGQVTIVTGPCRTEGGRTLLPYYPDSVLIGPPPSGQYRETFADLTIGQAPPAGRLERIATNDSNNAGTIVAGGAAGSGLAAPPTAGKAFALTGGNSTTVYAPPSVAAMSEGRALVGFAQHLPNGSAADYNVGKPGIQFQMSGTDALVLHPTGGHLWLARETFTTNAPGGSSSAAFLQDSPFTAAPLVWFNLELVIRNEGAGSRVEGKIWRADGAEPASPQISYLFATRLSAGRFGVRNRQDIAEFMRLAISADPAVAPSRTWG